MTSDFSAKAIAAIGDTHMVRMTQACMFLKECAARAWVPHAEHWQLDYVADGICPWRFKDHAADPVRGAHGRNTVLCFRHSALRNVEHEIMAYAHALRGIQEIRETGYSGDLMAPARRPPLARP